MVPFAAHNVRYSYVDYVTLEASSNVKHEYLGGQIYAMAGGTPEHAALTAAVVGLLFPQLLAGSCRAHSADLRVRVRETGLASYPDVTVVCGPRELDPDDKNAVINPNLLLEVLSPSTAEYDRGEKFEHYKQLVALKQYVLVAHDRRSVEVWTRGEDDRWSATAFADGEVASLAAIAGVLDVRQLYDAAAQPNL